MNLCESNKINEGLAEVYGALIGDGCLSKYYSNYKKKEIFCLLLTGHYHDEPYYRNTIRPVFYKEFGLNGCIRFRKDSKVVRFETTSKIIFDFFKELEFPVGVKHENLKIPEFILKENKLAVACVRGIFDTDGSIYRRYSKQYAHHKRQYNYLVIQFKLKNHKTIQNIKEILEKNQIKTTRITKDGSCFVLRLTAQDSVHKFMELIKPNNPYHSERYLNSSKSFQ